MIFIRGFRLGMLLQMAIGPICLFIFQTASLSGFLAAEKGVLGVAFIDGLYILAAIYSIGKLLDKKKRIKQVIKFLAAAVLILFGLSNLASVFGIDFLRSLSFVTQSSPNSVFLHTILLTLSNPLTILFWSGVFSSKIEEENLTRKEMCCFGIGAVVATLVFLTLAAIAGVFTQAF